MKQFYSGSEARQQYDEIIPAYQAAFAGYPWFEASKCPDSLQRCKSGLSKLAVGTCCTACGQRPTEKAYTAAELRQKFDAFSETKNLQWYMERNNRGLTLAALAWKTNAATVADQKYGNSDMKAWLLNRFGQEEFVWLDEVFANKANKLAGNLQNFEIMCRGLSQRLGSLAIAYRTVTPQMMSAPKRDFPNQTFQTNDLPDWRTFVQINLAESTL